MVKYKINFRASMLRETKKRRRGKPPSFMQTSFRLLAAQAYTDSCKRTVEAGGAHISHGDTAIH
ncbi:MAG TPA: hypothetical protein VL026_01085, partial [Rhizomicrobium sp.]|nr:hypothetical protein [Rhizomicrobium sp.]